MKKATLLLLSFFVMMLCNNLSFAGIEHSGSGQEAQAAASDSDSQVKLDRESLMSQLGNLKAKKLKKLQGQMAKLQAKVDRKIEKRRAKDIAKGVAYRDYKSLGVALLIIGIVAIAVWAILRLLVKNTSFGALSAIASAVGIACIVVGIILMVMSN